MISQTIAELEVRRLHTVAREYEHQGYKVVRQPSRADLPDFLSRFQPDMIAYGPHENVVVEVKSKATLRDSGDLAALAEAVNSQPGWRFELVVTNSQRTPADGNSQELGESGVRNRIRSVRELRKIGQDDAAVLLAWSAAESTLRLLANQVGVRLKRFEPAVMMKQLVWLGVLSRGEYDLLQEVFRLRNAIIHGYQPSQLEPHTIDKLVHNVEKWLLAATKSPAD